MDKEATPQTSRRATRLSSSSPRIPKSPLPPSKSAHLLSVNDLVFHGESISLDDVIDSFPGRRVQIHELINYLGPLGSPMIPLFVYGAASTGKTSVVLKIFHHLKRPFVYSSCITSYSPRILFESILNQILLHRKNGNNGYSSARRCDKPSDFVKLLREALTTLIQGLKGNDPGKSGSRKSSSQVNGSMVYLTFDHVEVVREWDKSDTILPLLFNLCNILKMPEVGLIFISRTSLDTFQSDTGYAEPFPVYFPEYTDDDLYCILLKDQPNPKLYTYFLDLVLKPFSRTTRRIDELSAAFSPLFKKYLELLGDPGSILNEEIKRKIFCQFRPLILPFLNETVMVPFDPALMALTNKDGTTIKSNAKKRGSYEMLDEIDFHMSTSAKYLLISAFLASKNPATLDASLFDSTGGSNNQKRKRKVSEKSMERKETKEQELLMKGPGTFPLERLLAIFQCITSVAEDLVDDGELKNGELEDQGYDNEFMSNILLQLSSLCSANFITKGGNCPLEGSTRYRSNVSEDLALKVARSLKFPLSKYLYRR